MSLNRMVYSVHSAAGRVRHVLALVLVVGIGLYFGSVSFAARVHQLFSARAAQADVRFTVTGKSSSQSEIWQEIAGAGNSRNQTSAAGQRLFRLNGEALLKVLNSAPLEGASALSESQAVLTLPMPDGGLARFRLQESPIMDPALRKRFPEIKSYRGQGIDDPTATMRCDWSPRGFHSLVLGAAGAFTIIPPNAGDLSSYAATTSDDVLDKWTCNVDDSKVVKPGLHGPQRPATSVGATLRTYRIAVAVTGEYTQDATLGGGSAAGALASINTWLNGVNAIYEKELSVRLMLIDNSLETPIIFTDAGADPFSNGNTGAMVNQVRTLLRDTVTAANFDVGHVLGTGGGGEGLVGVVCNNNDFNSDGLGPAKGGGASLMAGPVGNASFIGGLAHELGHQFGALHTHNAGSVPCGFLRTANSAYESGGGLTIMGYSGLCGADNISNARDLRFHSGSFQQITNYITASATCATTSATGNNPPTVNGGLDFTIPKNTPFTLAATGGDPDAGDVPNLLYTWEQLDAGGALYENPPYSDSGDFVFSTRPIFRPFFPTASASRTFPSLVYILNNANNPPDVIGGLQTAEELSQVQRQLNFRVTARDQRGGVNDDPVLLTVDPNSGPFAVTAPNTAVTWAGGTQQLVTWNVNGTSAAPVSCANVKLTLSTDGGQTFPMTLIGSTPNDGSETVTIPIGIFSTGARVKVEAIGNVFFDISDASFTVGPNGNGLGISGISPQVGNIGTVVTITGVNFNGVNVVKFTNNVNAVVFNVVSNTEITATVPPGAVTGPITLSKPGSPDVQTGSFTVCPSSPVTLMVDDGIAETAFRFGNVGGTTHYVARLTPASYPATLSQVLTYFDSASVVTSGTPIIVVAGTNTDGNTNINSTSFQTINATAGTANQFKGHNITPITINSGDFVVGFSIPFNPNNFPGVLDLSSPDNRSYVSTDGSNFATVASLGVGPNGDLMIRGQVFTGNCSGSGCTYSLMPTTQNFPAAGGSNTVNVIVDAGCPWTAVSNAAWVTVNSGSSGSGNGTVGYSVDANPGPQRSGTITIAGQTFTVTQDSGCNFSLTPMTQNFAAAGGNGSVMVTATAGCGWSATTKEPWINITAGSGTGNGTASFSVGPNTGPQRSGTINIAGQIFTVTQDNGCSFLIAPTNQNFTSAGGSSSVGVTTESGCNWTAVSNDAWLTVTGGATGSGNGVVGYSVGANTGNARTGTITIAGLTFTVNQDCPGFTITAHPNNTTACAGTPASFFVTASGEGPFSYQWRKNTVNIEGAINSTYSIGATAPGDAGTYDVVVTGSCGSVPSNAATLTINTSPEVTTHPGSQSVTVGSNVNFTAAANGSPAPALQWQVSTNGGFNFTDIIGEINPTLTLTGVTLAQNGSQYRAVFSNICNNTVPTNAATLTVTCPAITITPAPLPAGMAGTPYSQQLNGNGGLSPYSFTLSAGSLPNGVMLSGEGLLSGTPTASGTFNFTVQALDTNGCTGTQVYAWGVNPPCGTITVNPASLPNGFVGTVYNQALTGSGGTSPYTFTISAGTQPGGLNLSSGGVLSGTPTQAGTFNFTIKATDANGCMGTRAYTVIISGSGLQFYPLPSPVRLLETRAGFSGCTNPGNPIPANDTFTLPARTGCAGIPANAAAVTGNITVVPSEPGFLTLFPSTATQPTVANSNFAAGEITNNVFTVGLGAGDGAFKIFTNATTHIIADVTGYYAPPGTGGLYFHPLATPVRLLETRTGFTGCFAPGTPLNGTGDPNADPNQDLSLQGRSPIPSPCNSIPATAQVLVGNATSVLPSGGGYLTIYPSGGTRPTVASSNYAGSDVINGPFAVKLGADGKFKVYTFATTHLVIDILGYYSEDATDVNGAGLLFNPLPSPVRLLETRPDFPGFPLTGCTRTNAKIQGNLAAATHTQSAGGFCGLPASAQAVVGNVSVVNSEGAGFLTLFPGNLTTAPLVATSNYPAPATFGYNRHYFVGLSPANGTFKVLTQFTTDLILDASGYFAP